MGMTNTAHTARVLTARERIEQGPWTDEAVASASANAADMGLVETDDPNGEFWVEVLGQVSA